MAANVSKQRESNLIPLAIVAVLFLSGAGLFYFYFLRAGGEPRQQMTLTPEAKAYVRHLKLEGVEMKAAESFMKDTLVEITGKITNAGERGLRLVEINCVFYDAYNQVVLRERVPIVKSRGAVLAPGQTQEFRLPFDNLPQTWNQVSPQLVIARIDFEN